MKGLRRCGISEHILPSGEYHQYYFILGNIDRAFCQVGIVASHFAAEAAGDLRADPPRAGYFHSPSLFPCSLSFLSTVTIWPLEEQFSSSCWDSALLSVSWLKLPIGLKVALLHLFFYPMQFWIFKATFMGFCCCWGLFKTNRIKMQLILDEFVLSTATSKCIPLTFVLRQKQRQSVVSCEFPSNVTTPLEKTGAFSLTLLEYFQP